MKRQAKSSTTDLKVNIPQGWFTSQSNDDHFIDIWLIKDNYSASIIFLPIHFETQNILYDNILMERIFDLVKVKSESDGNIIISSKETIDFSGYSLLAFEFTNTKHERSRTVIFLSNGRYFQCTAAVVNSQITSGELFTIQNSILKSVFASK